MPYVKFALYLIPYLAFLYWVESWWGLIVVPFIFDICFTKKIKWGWWKEPEVGPATRFIMSWVDAIVFALIGVYFLTQFFFQNFVIPSSSLEKTLLTGDYLLVSKLAYGPRIPQTPLTMPMTQHTLPIINCKSYLEYPHWDYRRVKGLGNVEVNDIVVFNYPAGDTVALAQQNQDYYRLAYQIGDQLLGTQTADTTSIFPQTIVIPATASLLPETSYEEQQRIYNNVYAAGTAYMRQHPEEFGEITSRPTDRRENYVKRCVGLPGQTLQIKNDTVYLDGKPNPEPENVQYAYEVTFKQDLPDELKRELGITEEDLYAQRNGNTVWMPLTHKVRKQLEARKDIVASIARAVPDAGWLYPQNMAKDWTTANYGPLWIPKKGETLRLTLANLPIYERPIRVYEGNSLEVRGGKIYINGKAADSYTFKMDYYWMQGDNRDNSADSRFWGFVPEDHIVGNPLFIWISLDPDYGLFDGKMRWSRFFKWVGDIK
ncbi:MAG: S26 family signal peptidase [Bacteroidales bacterium]|nr:S26 family signal peptidase [Bacteroidales bacterium]